MKSQTKPNSRRKFLLAAGLGGAGAAAAVVTGAKVAQQASPDAPAAGGKRGYHVSEHILKYYKTAQV
jgi:predicted naringenin-chalcone synthase